MAVPQQVIDQLLPYWYNALDEEIGILISVDPTGNTKVLDYLYEARKYANDPELDKLIIMRPDRHLFFIAHKTTELDE